MRRPWKCYRRAQNRFEWYQAEVDRCSVGGDGLLLSILNGLKRNGWNDSGRAEFRMMYFPEIANSKANMVEFTKVMEYRIAVTEHYSRGLGKTIPELEVAHELVLSYKTQLSMFYPEPLSRQKFSYVIGHF